MFDKSKPVLAESYTNRFEIAVVGLARGIIGAERPVLGVSFGDRI